MDIEYIIHGYIDRGKFIQFWILFANMDFIHGSDCSSSSMEEDGGDRYFSQLRVLIYQITWKSGATSRVKSFGIKENLFI